jgi:hypothetical protein
MQVTSFIDAPSSPLSPLPVLRIYITGEVGVELGGAEPRARIYVAFGERGL